MNVVGHSDKKNSSSNKVKVCNYANNLFEKPRDNSDIPLSQMR